MSQSMNDPAASITDELGAMNARIDAPHAPFRQASTAAENSPRRVQPRRKPVEALPRLANVAYSESESSPEKLPSQNAGQLTSSQETSDDWHELASGELALNHAEDLAGQLAERFQRLERRELELAQYASQLGMAEQAAQNWVMERESEFAERERALLLREDELVTRLAANAAVEITAQREQEQWRAEWESQQLALEKREGEILDYESRLKHEQQALCAAMERAQAEQRQHEEQLRARRQQWDVLCGQDRAQAERAMHQLQRHRRSLEQREQQVRGQESLLERLPLERRELERLHLEAEHARWDATRELRQAAEQRWVVGRLWAKFCAAQFAPDHELRTALAQVQRELEQTYRTERESLEKLRVSLATMLRPTGTTDSRKSFTKQK